MIDKITQTKLNSIISDIKGKLFVEDLPYLKSLGNRLGEGYTECGSLINLPLNILRKTDFFKDEINQLLEIKCVDENSFILIIESQTKLGKHIDEGHTNQSPRLLASLSSIENTKIGFVISDQYLDPTSYRYAIFNPSYSLHDAYNSSLAEDWILLVLNLRDVCLNTEYIIYE